MQRLEVKRIQEGILLELRLPGYSGLVTPFDQ